MYIYIYLCVFVCGGELYRLNGAQYIAQKIPTVDRDEMMEVVKHEV
jgi:hypothetical protein